MQASIGSTHNLLQRTDDDVACALVFLATLSAGVRGAGYYLGTADGMGKIPSTSASVGSSCRRTFVQSPVKTSYMRATIRSCHHSCWTAQGWTPAQWGLAASVRVPTLRTVLWTARIVTAFEEAAQSSKWPTTDECSD